MSDRFFLDTNIFVYAIENHPKYGKSCVRILSDIQEKRIDTRASTLVLVELINVLAKLNKVLSKRGEEKLVIADNIAAVLSLPIIWIDLDVLIIETASTFDYGINGVDYVHRSYAVGRKAFGRGRFALLRPPEN